MPEAVFQPNYLVATLVVVAVLGGNTAGAGLVTCFPTLDPNT